MRRIVLFVIAACLIVGAWKQSGGGGAGVEATLAKLFSGAKAGQAAPSSAARKTWGNPATLDDHFARHGADFQARDAEDYARQAWEFGQRAKAGGLLVKVDAEGVRRVFDPRSGAFGAYNTDGTTRTFFKPDRPDYFARQPGRAP